MEWDLRDLGTSLYGVAPVSPTPRSVHTPTALQRQQQQQQQQQQPLGRRASLPGIQVSSTTNNSGMCVSGVGELPSPTHVHRRGAAVGSSESPHLLVQPETSFAYTPTPGDTNQSLTFGVAVEMAIERTLAIVFPRIFERGGADAAIEQVGLMNSAFVI